MDVRAVRRRAGRLGAHDRARFYSGVLTGFTAKLNEEQRTLETTHALVWKGDPRVEEHLRYHHPSIRHRSRQGPLQTRAYTEGKAEGKKLTLRKPLEAERGGFGGYLPG